MTSWKFGSSRSRARCNFLFLVLLVLGAARAWADGDTYPPGYDPINDAVDVAGDEECLTRETGTSGKFFEWQTCGAGGSSNSFETLDAPAGTDPVADSGTDTLTITEGLGLDITGVVADTLDFAFDSTELTNLTWSAGGSASIVHTFNVSGTDTTVTYGSANVTFSHDITVSGGDLLTGNIAFRIGDAATDNITLTTDGTGTAEVVLPTGAIDGAEIDDDVIQGVDLSDNIQLDAATRFGDGGTNYTQFATDGQLLLQGTAVTMTWNNGAAAAQTISYDGTGLNFDVSDDIDIEDVTPHLRLTDTTASQRDFEWTADGNQAWFTDVTNGVELLNWTSTNALKFRGSAVNYSWPTADGSSGQVLSTNGSGVLSWATAAGAGDMTAVGSMTSGDAFADSSADDDWLGLGGSAGRIEFDDQATDEVAILSARLLIGGSTYLTPAGGGEQLALYSENGTNSDMTFVAAGLSGSDADLVFNTSEGTLSARTIVLNSDILGAMRFAGFDGTNYEDCAYMDVLVGNSAGTAEPGNNDMPEYFRWRTCSDGSNSATTRMILEETRLFLSQDLMVGGGDITIEGGATDPVLTGGNGTLTITPGGNDLIVADDAELQDGTPHLRLTDTTASQDDYEWSVDGSMAFFSNITDGAILLQFDTTNEPTFFDDLNLEDPTPHLRLTDTTASQDDFELTADGSHLYGTDVTSGAVLFDFSKGSAASHVPSTDAIRLRTAGMTCGGTLSTTMDCEDFKTRIPANCTVQQVDLQVSQAPTTQAIIVDVNECNSSGASCTTLDSGTKPQIAAGATSGSDTAFTDTILAQGGYLQMDVDQVGSGTTGADLTVTVTCLQ